MATKPTQSRRATPRKMRKPPERQAEAPCLDAATPRDIGYARVSTLDQNLSLQQDALKEAGCEKTFIEQMSGAVADRPPYSRASR